MGQVFYELATFINIIMCLKFVGTEDKNITIFRGNNDKMKVFERFKETYGREYPNKEAEQLGFHNFAKNLAKVNRLNKEHHTQIIAYELNRYADLDPEAIREQFGLEIKPYDNMEHGNRDAIQRERRHKFIEDMNLYDLNQIDDLYRVWAKKWGKANFTKKIDKMVSYYRFAKTVAEANKQKFLGQEVSLGKDADVVREPNQYFYG